MQDDENLTTPEYLNWEDHSDQIKETQEKVIEAKKRRAVAYHDIFAKSDAGNKILTEWIQSYCTSKPAGRNATDREIHMNDGKRELISEILDQLKIGEQL